MLEATDAEAALRAALAAIRIPTPLPPTFADAMLEDEWVGPTLAALVAAASLAPPDAAEQLRRILHTDDEILDLIPSSAAYYSSQAGGSSRLGGGTRPARP